MSSWSHLPNAAHIDRVIASVEEHPEAWSDAYIADWDSALGVALDLAWEFARSSLSARDSLVWDAAWESSRNAAWVAVWDAGCDAFRDAAWESSRYAAWVAFRDAFRDAAWKSAGSAILALIAYDDCAKYLSMSSDQLRVWAILSENSAATLLFPAVVALEKISELEMA